MTLAAPPIAPDLRRRGLLHRIHRRYQTSDHVLNFGSIRLNFTRVADPDVVLDEVVAEEDRREARDGLAPLHPPYWAQLWESAGGLGAAISKMDLAGANVLDLGCGMGLCGAVAAARGANVLLADLESPALLFARLNTLPFSARVRTRRINWQTDRLSEKFDLILGADILYEKKQWEFLDSFWQTHLLPAGEILLGEPGRQSGEMFVPWIIQRGWQFTEERESDPGANCKPIRILRLRRQI